MDRRFAQHKSKKGAKYFFGRSPEKIVFLEQGHNRSTASKRECELKRYSRLKKLAMIDSKGLEVLNLSDKLQN